MTDLQTRIKALKLYGLLAHWDAISDSHWIEQLVTWEEQVRSQRSLERRLNAAHLGRFKWLNEFDWSWPKKCDRDAVENCMRLGFLADATNIILCGPNGVGKSTIACNIGHAAVIAGHTVLVTTASHMLNDLASCESDHVLRRHMKCYTQPQLLVIDEVGYLSYSNRHADLLFEIVSRRYQEKSTIVTTNKPFSEWGDIFPNAACVVSLIDRLVHHSEIISIEAESFRLKEAKEKTLKRKVSRQSKKSTE